MIVQSSKFKIKLHFIFEFEITMIYIHDMIILYEERGGIEIIIIIMIMRLMKYVLY